MIAMNLVKGNGYRFYYDNAQTLMRPPGYIFILAGIFSLFGRSLLAAKIFNILLATFTAFIIMKLSKIFIKDNVLAYIFPFIFLFHPAIIFSESRGGIEIFYTFMITIFIFVFYRAINRNKLQDYALAGGVFGMSLLVKQSHLLFIVFILPYLFAKKHKKKSIKTICLNWGVMLGCTIIIYSPWVIRNYYITKKFVPTMTLRGIAAYQGLYVNIDVSKEQHGQMLREAVKNQNMIARETGIHFKEGGNYLYFYSPNDEVLFDQILFNKVKQTYKQSPSLLLKCCLLNFFRFWFQGKNKTATILNIILILPLIYFIIRGIYLGYKNRLTITPLIIFIGSFILPHLPMVAVARHQVPLIPLLSIFEGLTIHDYLKRALLLFNKEIKSKCVKEIE